VRQHRIPISLIALTFLTISVALAFAAQDKYTVTVPGGLGSLSSGDTRIGKMSGPVRPMPRT